jgi:hypothetical protein
MRNEYNYFSEYLKRKYLEYFGLDLRILSKCTLKEEDMRIRTGLFPFE